eukprot:c7613_g1_i3.p1 GENE.c7613_g1_i3~~c7613_g1_i3.p1  ORF type:complete len:252 (-),score=50.35 c7613_g1_i3:256-1011(-)
MACFSQRNCLSPQLENGLLLLQITSSMLQTNIVAVARAPEPSVRLRELPRQQAIAVICAAAISWLVLFVLFGLGIAQMVVGAEFLRASCVQPISKWLLWYGSVNTAIAVWLKSLLHSRMRGSAGLRTVTRKRNSSFLIMLWIVFTLVGCSYVFGAHSSACNRTLHAFSMISLLAILGSLVTYVIAMMFLLRQRAVWNLAQPLPFVLSSWLQPMTQSSSESRQNDAQHHDHSRRLPLNMHQPGIATPTTLPL